MTYEELLQLTDAGIEIWKPIAGYEGYYEISNLGRVKSVDRYITCKGHPYHVKECIKSIALTASGYPAVSLSKNSKVVQVPIHQILMKAFVPNPENKPAIDHINTIKTDNSFRNLRWVTFKENSNNSITLQRFRDDSNSNVQKQRRLMTRKLHGGKTAPITVYQYTIDGNYIAEYFSAWDAQRGTGVHNTAIRYALDDTSKSAGGFMWFSSLQDHPVYKATLPNNTKAVIQYDLNNQIIGEWESLSAVQRHLGLNKSMVAKSIKLNQPYKNFIFRYK